MHASTCTVLLGAVLGATALCGCASSPGARDSMIRVDPTVLNGEWTVVTLDGMNAPALPETPRPVFVMFEDTDLSGHGRIGGFAGVNRYFGTYTATPEGTLEVGPLGATRMAGPIDQQRFENEFLKWLQHSQRYAVDHRKLTIVTGSGFIHLERPTDPKAR